MKSPENTAGSLRPLHEMETLFYYLTQGGVSGNASDVIVLDGPLERPVLEAALNCWVRRHPVLSSVLVKKAWRRLYWKPDQSLPVDIRYSTLDCDDEVTVFAHLTERAWNHGFELERERPIRFHYSETPSRTYLQVITSRLYTDGMTGALMAREIVDAYNATSRGETWDNTPVDLAQPRHRLFLNHLPWRRRLQLVGWGATELLRDLLASGHSLALAPRPRGTVRMQRLHLNQELLGEIRRFSRQNQCTVHVGISLAFIRACQVFNRRRGVEAEHLRLMDLFSIRRFGCVPLDHVFDSLAVPYHLRVAVGGSDAQLMQRIQRRLDELKDGRILAYLHVWSFFLLLAKFLPVSKAAAWLSRLERANVMLSNPGPTGEGLSRMGHATVVDLIDHPYLYPPERLFVIMSTFRGNLRGTVLFDEQSFPDGVEELLTAFVEQLERLGEHTQPRANTQPGETPPASERVDTLVAVTPHFDPTPDDIAVIRRSPRPLREQSPVVDKRIPGWHSDVLFREVLMGRSDMPTRYNAVDILEHNLSTRADTIALVSPDRVLTFAEVSAEANAVGYHLLRLGVRIGDSVAILSPDSAEWVAAFFGSMKIGAVVVSLNTLLTPQDYEYQLEDCRARVLFVHESLLAKVQHVLDRTALVEHVIVIGGERDAFRRLVSEGPAALERARTHRDEPCCINYSSGTTGEPKGITHTHADLPLTAQLVGVNVLGLRPEDRTYAVARLFFTFGTGGNLIFPWFVGASIIVSPESPRDPQVVLRIIETYRPTVLFSVPTGYASLLAVGGFPSRFELSSLRLCVSAGEALPARLWQNWFDATGLKLIDGIGSTENYHIFICNRPDDICPGSSGKPVAGYETKIVDDAGNPVTPGDVGELLVRGETAALCYRNKYEQSRRTFGEWLRTGDRYRVDPNGYYWYVGRTDDMLKVGGIWVSPTEVENTVLAHPAVQHCAVVAHKDAAELIKPKAFVVLKPGHRPTQALAEEIIAFAAARTAEFKRTRWIEFVDALPTTPTGKIQRFRLRPVSHELHYAP